MSNPLNQQPQHGNPSFLDFVSNIQNPQAFAQNMLQQNPEAAKFIQQLQNSANGMSPREMAMQLAKQKGIDPAQLNQIVSRFSNLH